ncbi:hypothetical protein BJY04DRAFT_217561 [Aspergillus karnatakaensis]|uniref:putative GPI anchored protein n=1 Tax=Aspergillus karnatakaensis TaxID=1810916 RepID=UPI003CCD3D40
MRINQVLAISGLMLLGNLTLGAELDRDDVPSPCRSACEPVVSAAQDCDSRHDNDTAEMQCTCDPYRAGTRIPRCEACIAQYRSEHPRDDDYDGGDDEADGDDNDDSDPHDNDAYDILTSCGFYTTTYASGGPIGSSSASASPSSSRSIASSSASASSSIGSISSSSVSASSSFDSSASSASSTFDSSASSAASSSTPSITPPASSTTDTDDDTPSITQS